MVCFFLKLHGQNNVRQIILVSLELTSALLVCNDAYVANEEIWHQECRSTKKVVLQQRRSSAYYRKRAFFPPVL